VVKPGSGLLFGMYNVGFQRPAPHCRAAAGHVLLGSWRCCPNLSVHRGGMSLLHSKTRNTGGYLVGNLIPLIIPSTPCGCWGGHRFCVIFGKNLGGRRNCSTWPSVRMFLLYPARCGTRMWPTTPSATGYIGRCLHRCHPLASGCHAPRHS
jgi:hypothetical protein